MGNVVIDMSMSLGLSRETDGVTHPSTASSGSASRG